MRIFRSVGLVVCFGLFTFSTFGKLIIVNTTNNISPGSGETNLLQAIGALEDGDTIGFNIPGTGPFYLITPPFLPYNGYPPITNNNVTIDGYTQPGSAPNSNTILSSNNARIQIVLDARDGLGYHSEEITGAYGLDESEQLLIEFATNITVRGLCFLGPGKGTGNGDTNDPFRYAVSFALGAHAGHVCGCWFGVDLDGTNVYRFRDAVTAFRVSPSLINGTVIGVANGAVGLSDARAQFNVMVGEEIPIALEGQDFRISGNFLNVFPDGITEFNANGMEPHDIEAFIEIGRAGNNVVIGTDGDGINDEEERNIFGGVTKGNDPNEQELIQWYSGARTNIIIAGNYFGVATDGVTRFTNSMPLISGLSTMSTVRIGSDFDGVSDELEANVIAMNYPFDGLYPSPGPPGPPRFAKLQVGSRVSLRGNQLIGNNIPPFSYADGYLDLLPGLTNYCAPFMATDQVIPVLATNSNQGRLRGACAGGVAPYTNVIIDVYLADPEGWTNGQKFELPELAYLDPSDLMIHYFGFAQGRRYVGSFVENGPEDLNPLPGEFEFDIRAFGLDTTTLITVAANYSSDSPGTHNGRTHTSDFAMPIILQPAPTLSVIKTDAGLSLLWPTNAGIFRIQSTFGVQPASWADVNPQPDVMVAGANYEAEITVSDASRFYRLAR
jgi:hypothetical protein